jgi:chromosome partitioning protein
MAGINVIANQKGGVGKTTTVMNLGAACAAAGLKTLMIDLDPQGALTVSHGVDPYTARPSTLDLLLDPDAKLERIAAPIGPNLFLAPSSPELISGEYRLARESRRTNRLKEALARADYGFEICLLDTPPSLGILTFNGLMAADGLIVPVATDYLAMRGVRALLESVWMIQNRMSAGLRLIGLVPTLYRVGASQSEAVVAEMRRVFKGQVADTAIPFDDAASAAPATRKSVLDYAPESPSAKAYRQLAGEILDQLSLPNRTPSIRRPSLR